MVLLRICVFFLCVMPNVVFDVCVMIKKIVEILVFHVTFFGVFVDFALLIYLETWINYSNLRRYFCYRSQLLLFR